MNFNNSISKKIFALILSLMLFLTLVITFFIYFSTIPSIKYLEEQEALKATTRVEKLVKANEAALSSITDDYGMWDDTRNLILNNELLKKYFSNNFTLDTFNNFNINFICLYDNNFKQIYGLVKEGDLLNNKFIFDLSKIYANGVHIYYLNLDSTKQTITRFAVQDITNSAGDPSSKIGYILIGQYLDATSLVSKSTGEEFHINIVNPEEVKLNGKSFYYYTDSNQIYSYFPLGKVNLDKRFFYVKLTQNRDLYSEILKSVFYVLIGIYGIFILLVVFLGLSLDRMIFKRLTKINIETQKVSLDNPKLIKIDNSKDEIGVLRRNLNSMLSRIEEEGNEKKEIEAQLRKQNLLWEKFLVSSGDPFWIKDQEGRYITVNNAYLIDEKIGNKEDVLGKSDFDLFPLQRALGYQKSDDMAKQKGLYEGETNSEAIDGRTYLTKKFPVFDDEKYIGIIGMSRDISELKKNEESLLKKEKILRDTTKLQQDLISKSEKVDIYNILMRSILGSLSNDRVQIFEDIKEKLSGNTFMQRVSQMGKNDSVPLFEGDPFLSNIPYEDTALRSWLPRLLSHEIIVGNTETFLPNERVIIEKYGIKSIIVIPIFVNSSLFGHISVESLIKRNWLSEEITLLLMAVNTLSLSLEKYMILKNLEISNFHDGLTGLYNRKFYEEEVKRMFSTKRNYPVSIIIGDLDGLKMTNDTLGHEKGDEMIINAAKCLYKIFRRDDIIARIGGDEFSVVLPNTSKEEMQTIYQRALNEIKNMNKNIKIPFNLSLGYATQINPEDPLERVAKEADNLMYSNKLENEQNSKNNVVESLLLVLASKDPTTEAHADRTSLIIEEFSKTLGFNQAKIDELKLFAKFHDIGKVGINDSIILKKDKLTPEEYNEIKRHSEIGYKITKFVPYLSFASEWILRHHERWDGTGYPGGLAGNKIPFESRIMALVDSFEVMTSLRPYRKNIKTKEEAIEEIRNCSGTQFDPELSISFIDYLNNSTKF